MINIREAREADYGAGNPYWPWETPWHGFLRLLVYVLEVV
jgi:hypothetical protein